MNPSVKYWNEQYAIGRPLEADSCLRCLLNRCVVAALMNTFPKTAARIFTASKGELARLIFVEREGGSFRTLRAMYRYENAHCRGNLLNRLLMESPAVKAARNRRCIAQRMLQSRLEALPPDQPALVLAVGGGDGDLEAEVLAGWSNRNVYYCGLDKDERAVAENQEALTRRGLAHRGLTITGSVAGTEDVEAAVDRAGRRFGVRFGGVSIAVCQGVAEYLDIGSASNETLARLLGALHAGTRDEGSLIISHTDYHDRVPFLERGLGWHMRLRDRAQLAAEVQKAGWHISLCQPEPMRLITMCLATKSAAGYPRVDSPTSLRQPHAKAPLRWAGRWRFWARARG